MHDLIMNSLAYSNYTARTQDLIEDARTIQVSGAAGAFDKEFRHMEKMIDEIRQIIESAQISGVDVHDIEDLLQSVRYSLKSQSVMMFRVGLTFPKYHGYSHTGWINTIPLFYQWI